MNTNKLDTSWFDIKNYDGLRTLPIEGWISIIEQREIAVRGNHKFYTKALVDLIKQKSPIIDNSKYKDYVIEASSNSKEHQNSYSTGSVNSLSSYDLWLKSRGFHSPTTDFMYGLNEACSFRHKLNHTHNLNYLTFQPHEINIKNAYYPDQKALSKANVSIDLLATDEQIKKDFDAWLRNYRNANEHHDIKNVKKSYRKICVKELVRWGVIPYIDLKIVSDFEDKEITDQQVSNLIFPNEVDIDSERIRKVVRPRADFLLKNKAHQALYVNVLSNKLSKARSTGTKKA